MKTFGKPHFARTTLYTWLLLLALGFIALGSALGAPYPEDGMLTEWVQPDGTRLQLRVFGDESYSRTTTDDGYTVLFDNADQTYYYARIGADGESLVSSGVPAHLPPPAGLSKHLEESRETVTAIQTDNVQQFATPQEALWEARVKAAQLRRAREAGLLLQNQSGQGPAQADKQSYEPAPDPGLELTSAATITGGIIGLMVLVEFPDDPTIPGDQAVPFPTDRAKIERYVNAIGYTEDGNTGSVRDYFRAQSLGMFDLTHVVTPIVTLPHPRNYYMYSNYGDLVSSFLGKWPHHRILRPGYLLKPECGKDFGSFDAAGRLLVADAIEELKTTHNFDFSSLSVDANNDIIDTSVFFAGDDSDCWSFGLWPHRSSIGPIDVGTSGNPRKVYGYQMTDIPDAAPVIGTVLHELGHLVFGFPDLYDSNKVNGKSAGVGKHSLMGAGNLLNGGRTPSPISLYHKEVLGWATISDITPQQQFIGTLPSTGNIGYRILKPGSEKYFEYQGLLTAAVDGDPNSTLSVAGGLPVNAYAKGPTSPKFYVDILHQSGVMFPFDIVSNTATEIVVNGSINRLGLSGTEQFTIRIYPEFFIFENRGDPDPWAQYSPDHGIMIWHVDEAKSSNGRRFRNDPEKENGQQQATAAEHYMVSLEQADGLFNLENNYSGDSADLYSTPVEEFGRRGTNFFGSTSLQFNDESSPDADWWDGTPSGIGFEVLSSAGPSMNVNFGTRLVTNAGDSGVGSLRWAIEGTVGGTIRFAQALSGEDIGLLSELVIDRDTTIDASGPSGLGYGITINGNVLDSPTRIFNITNDEAVVKLRGLTIANGRANDGEGAGIKSVAQRLEITGCTIYDSTGGSAIYNNNPASVVTIVNSTIANNQANNSSAIRNVAGEMIIEHSTVASNRNGNLFFGAGISNAGRLRLINTIVHGNETLFGGASDISGNFITGDQPNIVGEYFFGTVTGMLPITASPELGPLDSHSRENGGSTPTMLPSMNSSALNAAKWNSRWETDQRGFPRPEKIGANPDIGAVEVPESLEFVLFENPGGILDFDNPGSIVIEDSSPSLGSVLPGQEILTDFTIWNVGNIALSGLGTTFEGPDAAMFSITIPPVDIDGLGETHFQVRFVPTSSGEKFATLNIATNDPDNNPFQLALTGIGSSTFSTTRTTGGTPARPLLNPTWNRPDAGSPPTELSATATDTPYDVVSFTVSREGEYTLTSTTTNPGWDNHFFLYFDPFDASAPLATGLIGAKRDPANGLDEPVGFTYTLYPEYRYYAVTTGTTNFDRGDYTLEISGPGEFEVFAPPAITGPSLSQAGVSAYPTFSWTSAPGASYEIFLGTDPSNLVTQGFHTSPFTLTSPLSHGTIYYWRLDSLQSGAVVSGGVQRFTTRDSIEVTTLEDEDDGALGLGAGDSLREAIASAAADEASAIAFAPGLSGQTIRLGGSPLVIPATLTIDSSSLPVGVTVSGDNASRVFEIAAGETVVMDALTIAGGTVPDGENGAGILNRGTLTLKDTTLHGNRAHTGKGGGIHNLGVLILENSTLSENDASHGGGIYNEGTGSSATLTNVTVSGNTAADGGGGITHASDASLTLIHVTMAGNFSSLGRGAGIEITSGSLAIENSIIAGNDAMNGSSSIDKTGGAISPGGANIIGDNTSVSTEFPPGSLVGTAPDNLLDPELSPLDFFDGRTQTRPPLPGSPAFDAAVITGQSPPQDQRGVSRSRPPAPDIGSVESELSSNADLASLATSAGKLDPVFISDVTEYAVSVAASVASARVRMSPDNDQATVKVGINGGGLSTLAANATSSPLPLNAGDNLIEAEVTAENGATKSYTIAVTRGAPPATNTDLKSLAISAGSLSPAFALGVTSYSTIVDNGTTDITVTPATGVPDATVEAAVNFGPFNPVAPGTASSTLALDVGSNLIEIKVTAKDGTTVATHTLTVIREAPAASNANLSALLTNAGALRPGFSREVFFYNVRVNEEITSATVTPTAVQPSLASIEVQVNEGGFSAIASDATSSPLALNPGANFIEVKVASQDGTSVNSYTIKVTRATHDLEWVSKDLAGLPGDNPSISPSISADGRYVAFSSSATNLVAGDTNNSEDIFVYDRDANTIERVSIDNNGVQGDFDSTDPSISADGRYVAFHSEATNLVPGDTNGDVDISFGADIFVYDRDSGTIERVSLTDSGGQSNQASETPTISGDGRYVAFASHANNLVSGFETHSNVNIYIHDRDADSIVGIDVPFGDFRANRDLLNPAVSADGSFVAFELSVNRSEFPQYQYTDIYLYHQSNRTVERITGDYEGLPSDGNHSKAPSISDDGRYVAFHSTIDGIDFDDTNGAIDVFVYDRIEGRYERLSASATGADEPSKTSGNPSISGDGRYVAFQSRATNLVEPATNGLTHIYRKDLLTGDLAIMSINSAGDEGNQDSGCNLDVGQISCPSSMSFDGQFIAFESMATNLDATGATLRKHIFVAVNDAFGASPVADLRSLVSNLGPLSANVTSYSAGVSHELDAVIVRPQAADPDATIEVQINSGGFNPVDSEQISSLPLIVGINSIEFRVTAADGSTVRMYSLEVTRDPSADATLAGLTLNGGIPDGPEAPPPTAPLTPGFLSDVTVYAAEVSNELTSLTVTPTLGQADASVTVNGEAVSSGTASNEISLNRGVNTITVVVTAQDNATTKTYVVTVSREFSRNADLVSLVANAGALTPEFDSGTTGYVIEVPNDTTSITVTPTPAQADATMTVNGETVTSGTASSAIDLYAGTNTISTLVTAEDGGTTKTYAITVTREGATNADLASLVLSAGTLMPAFTSNTTSYTVSAPNAMTSITVTPTVVDSTATVNVNGVTVASGTASSAISLGVGANTITILVTAGDGTTVKSYAVEVTRAPNTPLADVVIDFGPQAGIWLRYSNSMWLKLHPISPESMVAGDIDGNGEDDLIVNFGPGVGIWVRYDNMTWAKLHPTSPDSMVTGDIDGNGQDDVMIDFGPGTGIWVRYNNATWTKLHPTSPDSMVTGDIDGNGQDDVMIDFGPGVGIWVRYNNSTWAKLHPTSPDSMVTGDIDGNGQDDVMIDFGPGTGIWVRYNDAAWAKLHPTSPDSMVTGDIDGNGQDDVMIDFGPGTGIWVRYNNATWTKLHPNSPEIMVTGDMDGNGKDEVVIDFGLGTGIWIRYNDTAWSKLHSSHSESMVVSEYNKQK